MKDGTRISKVEPSTSNLESGTLNLEFSGDAYCQFRRIAGADRDRM